MQNTTHAYGSTHTMRSVDVHTMEDRVGLINYYIQEGKRDPQIRKLVSTIISQRCGSEWCVPEKDWIAEVSAIFYWIRANVRYTLDPYDLELFQRARRSLENQTADCDDQVILAGALLQAVGYPIRIIIIGTTASGYNHVYLAVGIPPTEPTKWIPFDLTAVTEPLVWEMPSYSFKRIRAFEM